MKKLFSGKCRITAEADESGAMTMTVDGRGDDVCILLASVVNQIAEKIDKNPQEFMLKIMAVSPALRALEGYKIAVDGSAVKRARRDGNE